MDKDKWQITALNRKTMRYVKNGKGKTEMLE